MTCCTELSDRIEGKSVKDIPDLHYKLVELSTDFKSWSTTLKCPECGQVWIERFAGKGHGEVPEVYKLK